MLAFTISGGRGEDGHSWPSSVVYGVLRLFAFMGDEEAMKECLFGADGTAAYCLREGRELNIVGMEDMVCISMQRAAAQQVGRICLWLRD